MRSVESVDSSGTGCLYSTESCAVTAHRWLQYGTRPIVMSATVASAATQVKMFSNFRLVSLVCGIRRQNVIDLNVVLIKSISTLLQ